MMRIKITMLFLGLAFSGIGQEAGYFGKKGFLDIDLNGSVPLFQNIFVEKGYEAKNGKLKESYNLIDFGFRMSLGKSTSQTTGIAFEYGYRQFQVNPLIDGELNRQYIGITGLTINEYIKPRVAFIDIRENIFMPKFIFANDFSHIPAGFSNEIGIGYTVTSIKNRSPLTESEGSGIYSADSISANLIDPDLENMSGMTFMYGFKMNYPISKSLLFHIGFRYSYNTLFGKRAFRKEELSESWLSEREMWSRINQRRQLGIVSFSAGFTICL